MDKYIVGIGAANVDIVGKSFNSLIMKDSNPGTMLFSVGGVTRNVCENIARLGANAHFIGALGDDYYGQVIVDYSTKAGIDMSDCLVVKGAGSSSYTAILDESGDMALALSDMRVINNLTPDFIGSRADVIKNSELIIFDPCLPEETIDFIIKEFGEETPLFCDPVSTSYAKRLKPYTGKLHTIKPNKMELAVLADHPTETIQQMKQACQILVDKGVKRIFVSLGKDGCLYYDYTGTFLTRKLTPVEQMVNASGAGDSFMAAAAYGFLHDFSIEKTIDYALAAGIAAITSKATINPDISVEMLENIIKERG